jgi:hypothetical protein
MPDADAKRNLSFIITRFDEVKSTNRNNLIFTANIDDDDGGDVVARKIIVLV